MNEPSFERREVTVGLVLRCFGAMLASLGAVTMAPVVFLFAWSGALEELTGSTLQTWLLEALAFMGLAAAPPLFRYALKIAPSLKAPEPIRTPPPTHDLPPQTAPGNQAPPPVYVSFQEVLDSPGWNKAVGARLRRATGTMVLGIILSLFGVGLIFLFFTLTPTDIRAGMGVGVAMVSSIILGVALGEAGTLQSFWIVRELGLNRGGTRFDKELIRYWWANLGRD